MEQEELIANFCAIANCDSERAKFFLSAANWELETALNAFFLDPEGTTAEDEVHEISPPQSVPTKPPTLQEVAAGGGQTNRGQQHSKQSRFGTLASINVDDDSSDDDTNKHYAGGSEHSGQLIKGPPSNRVQDIFNSAKEHGAEVVEDAGSDKKDASQRAAFGGSGFKLGNDGSSSEHVPGSNDQGPRPEQRSTITFWKNGFTVDDGPLRSMNEPSNQEFLQAVMRGEIPQELVRLARGAEVHVNMVDNRTEDFVPPKPQLRPFSGSGHKLGSPVPEVMSSSEPHRTPTNPPTTSHTVDIDESAPVTSIQIRLSDGTRLVSKFNHVHTISDIRNFINLSRPNAPTSYTLMTTFPNKVLSVETQTLKEAGLLNACIVQKKC